MKKVSILFFTLILSVTAISQQFKVVNFWLDAENPTARLMNMQDNMGKSCALLIVRINDYGVEFNGDIVGKPRLSKKIANTYELWIPGNTREIEVLPSNEASVYVSFKDYYAYPIEGKKVYVLELNNSGDEMQKIDASQESRNTYPVVQSEYDNNTQPDVETDNAESEPDVEQKYEEVETVEETYEPQVEQVYELPVEEKVEPVASLPEPEPVKEEIKPEPKLEQKEEVLPTENKLTVVEEVKEKPVEAVETPVEKRVEEQILDNGNISFTVEGVQFTMVYVEGGDFNMGAQRLKDTKPNYDVDAEGGESPVHNVIISNYYIGETEITQELWLAVMGKSQSRFFGNPQNPAERVSWEDAKEFITRLNAKTGKTFRLPTEAEWEYAARGGNKSQGYKYSGSDNIDDVAWNYENSSSKTYPVKTKKPNELGIYDMSGNVEEWCNDWSDNYKGRAQENPQGPKSGQYRTLRGGSYDAKAQNCRVSYRTCHYPSTRAINFGFRLVMSQTSK